MVQRIVNKLSPYEKGAFNTEHMFVPLQVMLFYYRYKSRLNAFVKKYTHGWKKLYFIFIKQSIFLVFRPMRSALVNTFAAASVEDWM